MGVKVIGSLMAGLLGLGATASAQDDLGYSGWDLLPSPGDVAFGKGKRAKIGVCDRQYFGAVDDEVQKIYQNYNMCNSYNTSLYREFYLAMAKYDANGRNEQGISDYETVANYFNYHGITWWDGRTSPGYRETARRAGQVPPGLTARYTGTATTATAPAPRRATPAPASVTTEMARLQAAPAYRPAASEFANGGAPGACGIPYLDEAGREEQAFFAEEGECDEYVAEVEAEGY